MTNRGSLQKFRQLRQAKEDAYRKEYKVSYKQAKYTLEKEIRVAKMNYSGKLRNKLSSSDSASVWKGMKIIIYKTPFPSTVENQQLADDLIEFYCRFEKTVEMIVDFRKKKTALPLLTIMNSTETAVESVRFLDTTISQDLKWDNHIESMVKKAQQRL